MKHRTRVSLLLVIISILILFSACGTLEIGIEHTSAPTTDSDGQIAETATPTVWLTPTPHMDTWNSYSNPVFGVSLEYPSTWQPVDGYGSPEWGEIRFAGVNGFFHINAMNSGSLEDAASSEAGHRLQPYGSRPIIENTQVQGQEARLILPSVDQDAGLDRQAALIVSYPEPVSISTNEYQFFVLWADMEHIRTIAQTLRFHAGPPPTPVPQPLVWENVPPGLIYSTPDGTWMIGADEQPVQLINNPQAVISPDGTRLVSYDSLGQDAWLIDIDSGGITALTRTPDRTECCFKWWPARPDTLLFASIDQDVEPGPGIMGYLSAIGLDGEEYAILDAAHDVGLGQFAASPDGSTIAYGSGSTAWLYRWGVGSEVFDPVDYGLSGYGEIQIASPAWSPDGRTLAWILKSDIAVGGGYRAAVVLFDLDARTATIIHPYEAQGVGWPSAPVWSPDGQWIAFGDSSPTGNAGLWIAAADGQQERHLGLGGNPVWSPDGNWLAYQSVSQNGPITYNLVDVTTWQPTPLGIPYNNGLLLVWIRLE